MCWIGLGGGTVLVEKRLLYADAINFDKDQVAIFPPPSLFEQPACWYRINWGCFLLWSVLIDLFCVGVKNEDKLDLGFQRNQFQIPKMTLKERRERKLGCSYSLFWSFLGSAFKELGYNEHPAIASSFFLDKEHLWLTSMFKKFGYIKYHL